MGVFAGIRFLCRAGPMCPAEKCVPGGGARGPRPTGRYVEADSEEAVAIKADENSGVAWFTPEEALVKSTEPWFVEHVYAKLLEKMKTI